MHRYVYVRDIVRDVRALYKRDKIFEEFKFVIVFNFTLSQDGFILVYFNNNPIKNHWKTVFIDSV